MTLLQATLRTTKEKKGKIYCIVITSYLKQIFKILRVDEIFNIDFFCIIVGCRTSGLTGSDIELLTFKYHPEHSITEYNLSENFASVDIYVGIRFQNCGVQAILSFHRSCS